MSQISPTQILSLLAFGIITNHTRQFLFGMYWKVSPATHFSFTKKKRKRDKGEENKIQNKMSKKAYKERKKR
jgi:hypothetical protein